MFKEEYQKEMEKITPSQTVLYRAKAALRGGAREKRGRSLARPAAALAAVAAVICLAVFGGTLFTPQANNLFTITAYAVEQTEDGAAELREVDLANHYDDAWGGYWDGDNFYVNVGLKCEGENIESVEFSTEDGFFAKQTIGELSARDGVPTMYVGTVDAHRIAVYGTDFEKIGNTLTLDKDTLTDDLLLFWGKENVNLANDNERPQRIDIQAKVTFTDGQTQEQTVTIDLSTGLGLFAGPAIAPSAEEIARQEYYRNVPLEECELIPESVETLNGVYEYAAGGASVRFVIVEDALAFDENGVYRSGFWGGDGDEILISVIRRGDDGVLTGMTYKAPKRP